MLSIAAVVAMIGSTTQDATAQERTAHEALAANDLFQRVVKPAFSETCFKCHGPDDGTREADLRLDTAEGARQDLGGSVPIKPGDPDGSEVWRRINSSDPDEQMPPPDSGLVLTADQREAIGQWIETGAEYETHWAFQPLSSASPPLLPGATWPRSPLDAFVMARWQPRGLTPDPTADRSTLIRRLSLDLLGIAPDPDEVQEFVDDSRPDAVDRLIDRLLASPHVGERWGRHWLDQARYADTNGYTVDSERSMWPYRDWVIEAVNADLPFDEFTIAQLAGDLLPEPSEPQLVATGFHRNTLINQEGGADAEQFRNEAVVDRVNTTGAVWLGLTVGCSQCHNHKYDPLKQSEYYQLFAFFNSTQDVNSVAPVVQLATAEQRQRLKQLDEAIAAAQAELAAWRAASSEAWQVVEPTSLKSEAGAQLTLQPDGSVLLSGANGDADRYLVQLKLPAGRWTAVRLEALTHDSLPNKGPGRASHGNFVLNEIRLLPAEGDAIAWATAVADHSQQDYPVAAAIDGVAQTGWAINLAGGKLNVNRTAVFAAEQPLASDGEQIWTLVLEFGAEPPKYNLGRFRVAVTDVPVQNLDLPDPEENRLRQQVETWVVQRDELRKSLPTTMVMREKVPPRESFVLIRGDFLRQGARVEPDTPAFLPPLEASSPSPNRLDLARWLVAADQPLTPRVGVNRMWMQLFGRGLVETENDFGAQGTLPTHPLLLDWLAGQWIKDGWSRKSLLRRMIRSATYQQSSVVDPEKLAADPRNLWLARQSRVRVEAEVIRDLGLSVSGLLDRRIGGPSVYPPQPAGVYDFTQRRASWPTSQGADRYRRGLYTFFMRSAPHPMLTTFDTPRFNTVCTRRIRSNTPLQSLTLSNDEAMIEIARGFAARVERESDGTVPAGVDFAFRAALGRTPREAEQDRLIEYWESSAREFLAQPPAARQLVGQDLATDELARRASWVALCRVLMNLDEFITRE